MRIGYPCLNYSLGEAPSTTFRLKSYSEERLRAAVEYNLGMIQKMLAFNADHQLLFFRLHSGIVPFASHPICSFKWKKAFADTFVAIGAYVRSQRMRISMHPDQFTLINSPSQEIFERSVRELIYHVELLEAMGLRENAKIQIHVGGVYGDKEASLKRFIERFGLLPEPVRKRLVIENDDRLFDLQDCLRLHNATGVPILFDTFHHEVLPTRHTLLEALQAAAATWRRTDGPPMIDYSSQLAGERRGNHSHSLNADHFKAFLKGSQRWDGDVMLEIKDKEKSAIQALALAQGDSRLNSTNPAG